MRSKSLIHPQNTTDTHLIEQVEEAGGRTHTMYPSSKVSKRVPNAPSLAGKGLHPNLDNLLHKTSIGPSHDHRAITNANHR
ncbi:MAG: hypothetical protein ACRDF4_04075 [Rhabdochlamydiaceae bacterium]